jgi:tetratricopeptide (TPR) repeat protein
MSRTLNLCEYLLYEGRRYYALGVDRRALQSFGHLARLRSLSPDIAEETQLYLAKLLLKQRNFAKARRHLTAALAHDSANPDCHYLLACCHEDDPKGNRRLALLHYRRCLKLDPDNPRYYCDAGIFALSQGHEQLGTKWLQHTADLTMDDSEVIDDVIRCLQEHGHHDKAQRVARTAFFRNHRNPAFQRLWQAFRYRLLQSEQRRSQGNSRIRRVPVDKKVRLPFLKLTIETPNGRKLVRQDGPSRTPPPHFIQLPTLPDQKHA